MIEFAFAQDPRIISAFSQREDGNMSLSYGDTQGSLKNREKFLTGLGIDYGDLVCAKQTHSSKARYVTEKERGKGALTYDTAIEDTDALITDKTNLPLAVFTADCLSVFLFDPETPAIGIVHAGWRGTKVGIASEAVELMRGIFKSRPERVYAGFGPTMRDCCYEVGEDLKASFPDSLSQRGGNYYLDLPGINKRQLIASGLKEGNIRDCRQCTYCRNDSFFSYRKEKDLSGRLISVIMLK